VAKIQPSGSISALGRPAASNGLIHRSVYVLLDGMRFDHDHRADALVSRTPGWATTGLAAASERERHEAAQERAKVTIEELGEGTLSRMPHS
jgi:hypothetical protein